MTKHILSSSKITCKKVWCVTTQSYAGNSLSHDPASFRNREYPCKHTHVCEEKLYNIPSDSYMNTSTSTCRLLGPTLLSIWYGYLVLYYLNSYQNGCYNSGKINVPTGNYQLKSSTFRQFLLIFWYLPELYNRLVHTRIATCDNQFWYI